MDEDFEFISLAILNERIVEKLSAGKLAMNFDCGGEVSSVRCLGTIERAEVTYLAMPPDLGDPLLSGAWGRTSTLEPSHTAPRNSLVALVLARRALSQINEPIVAPIAVDVVNVFRGPTSMHVKPDSSVGQILPTVDEDSPVSLSVEPPGDISSEPSLPRTVLTPSEDPGVRRIDELFAEFFSSDHLKHQRLSQKKINGAQEDAGHADKRDQEDADRELAVVRRD